MQLNRTSANAFGCIVVFLLQATGSPLRSVNPIPLGMIGSISGFLGAFAEVRKS